MGFKIEIINKDYQVLKRNYYSTEEGYRLWLQKRVKEIREDIKFFECTVFGYKDTGPYYWEVIDEIPIGREE